MTPQMVTQLTDEHNPCNISLVWKSLPSVPLEFTRGSLTNNMHLSYTILCSGCVHGVCEFMFVHVCMCTLYALM